MILFLISVVTGSITSVEFEILVQISSTPIHREHFFRINPSFGGPICPMQLTREVFFFKIWHLGLIPPMQFSEMSSTSFKHHSDGHRLYDKLLMPHPLFSVSALYFYDVSHFRWQQNYDGNAQHRLCMTVWQNCQWYLEISGKLPMILQCGMGREIWKGKGS